MTQSSVALGMCHQKGEMFTVQLWILLNTGHICKHSLRTSEGCLAVPHRQAGSVSQQQLHKSWCLCSASVAVLWQQSEPLWTGGRGAFNGLCCAMGPPDLLLDKFDINLKAKTHSRKRSTPEDWDFCCVLLCLPTRKFPFAVTCPSVGTSLCLSLYLFRAKDFFQISACTGPERMGHRSNLKDSAHSAKAMEDISRGYSNTREVSKPISQKCKIYIRNVLDTTTALSTLSSLFFFCAGDHDDKLLFFMSSHQIDSVPVCCVSLNHLLRKLINISKISMLSQQASRSIPVSIHTINSAVKLLLVMPVLFLLLLNALWK